MRPQEKWRKFSEDASSGECLARRIASEWPWGAGTQKSKGGCWLAASSFLPVLASLTSPFPPLALAIAIFNANGNGQGANRCSPEDSDCHSCSAQHNNCHKLRSYSTPGTKSHNTRRKSSRQTHCHAHFRHCNMGRRRMRAAAGRAASAPAPSPPEPPTTGWFSGAQELPHAEAASLQGFSQ